MSIAFVFGEVGGLHAYDLLERAYQDFRFSGRLGPRLFLLFVSLLSVSSLYLEVALFLFHDLGDLED